jgi:hypothetical protein
MDLRVLKGLGNLLKLIVTASVTGMSAARICVRSQLSLRVSMWPAAFYHDARVVCSTTASQVQVIFGLEA